MKASARQIIVLGMGALVVAAVAVFLLAANARRKAASEIKRIQSLESALAPMVRAAETRRAKAERDRLEAQKSRPGLEKPRLSSEAPAKPVPAAPYTFSQLIAESPVLEVLELNRQRWAFRVDFEHLFHLLGLTAAQRAKLEELHAAYTERDMDLRATGMTQDDAGRQTLAELQKQSKAQHEQALLALLGPDNYRRMHEYDRTIPLRNGVVRGFAGAAALEGMPITAEQGESMVRALVAAGGDDVSGPRQDLSGIDWEVFEHQVDRILSPAQLKLIRTVNADVGFSSRFDGRLRAEIRRAFQSDATTKPD